jgi:hypothetical protein
MGQREKRIGENEAVFRLVNERIEDMNAAFGTITETMTVICECGDLRCAEQIEVELAMYERVRSDPTLFIVERGHAIRDLDEVVEQHAGFDIVRKRSGEAVRIVRERDPRG